MSEQLSTLCPLTVVMPAYNEEGAIEAAVDEVRRHVLDRVAGSCLLVVDDGSRDGTGRLLDALAVHDSRVQVVHQPNGGHGSAVMTGLTRATSEFVFLIDSDQQIPLDGFFAAWSVMRPGVDGVFGVRRKRNDPTLRLILTSVVRRVIRLLFGVPLYDANVPYKLIRRSAWEHARPFISPDTLAPSLFLAAYMKRSGMNIIEVEIDHRERQTGVVSIRRWKLVKFCAKALGQLLRFRYRLRSA
ncbi:MAG: glycosyltransferase family 2 protein [Gemmatimonadaceae bacterium]